jgi:hypothetical protein
MVTYQPDGGVTELLINDTLIMQERFFFSIPRGYILTITVKDSKRLGLQPIAAFSPNCMWSFGWTRRPAD